MSGLDELLKRATIEFPVPINSAEIQDNLFSYLEQNLPVSTRWSFSGFGYGSSSNAAGIFNRQRRYLDKLNLTISKNDAPFNFASYEFQRSDEEDYFDAVRLSTPGVDDLDELMAMPTGEGQLELTDKLRSAVNSYFSQRQK